MMDKKRTVLKFSHPVRAFLDAKKQKAIEEGYPVQNVFITNVVEDFIRRSPEFKRFLTNEFTPSQGKKVIVEDQDVLTVLSAAIGKVTGGKVEATLVPSLDLGSGGKEGVLYCAKLEEYKYIFMYTSEGMVVNVTMDTDLKRKKD